MKAFLYPKRDCQRWCLNQGCILKRKRRCRRAGSKEIEVEHGGGSTNFCRASLPLHIARIARISSNVVTTIVRFSTIDSTLGETKVGDKGMMALYKLGDGGDTLVNVGECEGRSAGLEGGR